MSEKKWIQELFSVSLLNHHALLSAAFLVIFRIDSCLRSLLALA